MNLQDQCCTVEQGKRLQELGVKAEATFWHMPEKSHLHGEYIRYGWHGDAIAPAYNVAELGNRPLCPDYMATWFAYDLWWWCDLRNENPFSISGCGTGVPVTERGLPTEAQARAEMIIYVLEGKINNHV